MGSDYLYIQPSFSNGFARALDFFGTLTSYNKSETPAQADSYALFNDWVAIGNDMEIAYKALENNYKCQNQNTKDI